jgi:cellulose synthase/poly-beta-1,6-N-acetylglucosamine synthase-like glycosyltransferase
MFEVLMTIYAMVSIALLIYGLNAYYMLSLLWRNRNNKPSKPQKPTSLEEWPIVTSQLPLYNEANVVERLLKAVVEMDYPGHHEIQICDDSTDGSELDNQRLCEAYCKQGFDVSYFRRDNRKEFKAGALREAMEVAKGSLISIFDADFVPTPEFLIKSVPYFCANPKLALVQGRWEHLNRKESLLTLAQSIGIDGHFWVEQVARNRANLFMNFNGTAGIWRKEAIEDSGNWQGDTLTEDLDLSYRVQMQGWQMTYLVDLDVPAEIPADINAFKQQQARWARGSIQTAKKLLLKVWKKKNIGLVEKFQATLHLTHYSIHPLMLLSVLVGIPLLVFYRVTLSPVWFSILAGFILLSSAAPSTLYATSQIMAKRPWKRESFLLPILMLFGSGLAVSNTFAVLKAFSAHKGVFMRTPKKGDKVKVNYKTKIPGLVWVEFLMSFYCLGGVYLAWQERADYLAIPFIVISGVGYLVVGLMSLSHSLDRGEKKAQSSSFNKEAIA